MNERQVRRMLREMASGEPVLVRSPMASTKKLAQLAFIAQQFGYEYADARQGGGPQGNGLLMLIVPDPGPEAQARAAKNWARYPNAHDGESLPPLVPEAVELLKARMKFDLTSQFTDGQRYLVGGMVFTMLGLSIGLKFRDNVTAIVVIAIVWAALMALLPLGNSYNQRYAAKCAARLRAAGFQPVTDESGRLRYVPRGGQLPGHGNPFTGKV
nr:hypothetical protein [Streptomyces sp. TP-A0874]